MPPESNASSAAPAPRFFRDGLTGLRALAALWVTMFYLNALVGPKVISVGIFGFECHLHPLITIGWVGANIFFVLSGFLLTTHLMETQRPAWPRLTFRNYFIARIRRVFPAYWAQLAVLFLIAVATSRALPEWTDTIPLHLPMIHNLTERASFAINPVYWTLPIEFSFYLCLPLVARWLLRAEVEGGAARWRTLAFVVLGTLTLSWCYRIVVFSAYRDSPVNTIVWALSQIPGTIDQFILGTAAAAALRWWKQDGHLARRGMASLLCAASLAGIVAMMYFLDSIFAVYWSGHWAVYVWYSAAAGFVALLIVSIALSGALPRGLFENRVAIFLGTISYSIYLWHFPIAVALAQALDAPRLGLGRFVLIALPAILAASCVSYYLVERPFLARKAAELAPRPT